MARTIVSAPIQAPVTACRAVANNCYGYSSAGAGVLATTTAQNCYGTAAAATEFPLQLSRIVRLSVAALNFRLFLPPVVSAAAHRAPGCMLPMPVIAWVIGSGGTAIQVPLPPLFSNHRHEHHHLQIQHAVRDL